MPSSLSVPLYVLIIIYAIFLVIFFIFFLINSRHLMYTGAFGAVGWYVTIGVLTLAISIISLTTFALRDVSWQQELLIWDSRWVTSLFSV